MWSVIDEGGAEACQYVAFEPFPPIFPQIFVRSFVWFVRIVNETSERWNNKKCSNQNCKTQKDQKDQDKRYIPVAVVEDEDDDVGGIIISVVADCGGGCCGCG